MGTIPSLPFRPNEVSGENQKRKTNKTIHIMKKIFTAVLALAVVAACNKAEVIGVNDSNAIAFDNAFVDNATKSVNDPSFTNNNLFADFAVYGFVEGAVLFDGTKVSKGIENGDLNSVWKYEGTQYWIAGAQYNFNAVAPMTAGGWTKSAANATSTTLSFVNNGTTDLLYATTAQEGKVSGNADVAFSFRHVLSKVKFSFENAYNATNATIKVKDIVITNPHKTGDVVLTGSTVWSNLEVDDLTLAFGMATDDEATTDAKENAEVAIVYSKIYESQNERFLIPSTTAHEYEVTFTVELLVSGTKVATYYHDVTAKFAPAAGNSYDIKAVINAENIDPDHAQEPIEFTVNELSDWANTTSVDAQYPQNN